MAIVLLEASLGSGCASSAQTLPQVYPRPLERVWEPLVASCISDPINKGQIICPKDEFLRSVDIIIDFYGQARKLQSQNKTLQTLAALDKAEQVARRKEAEAQADRARRQRWWWGAGGILLGSLATGLLLGSR